ncbi:hypothetical protein AADG42_16745 [Ammonicoccus fulvus]|uniref:DUF4386 family protein n=1 Tax=Ammonicoccus fulvus TaxID=3138240 RepID=A0ABZ3FVW5_9ACTN
MSQPSTRATGLALLVIGALMIANGAWYTPLMLTNPAQRMSEYGGEWPFVTSQTIAFVVLVALALAVPRLRQVRSRTGRTLPGWLITVLTVAVMLQMATVYVQAFVVPFLAEVAPAALDVEAIDVFALSMMAIWVLWLVTWVVVAVVGVVRRLMGIPAAILIAFGALSTPVLGPGGAALVGAGLVVWCLTRILPAARARAADATLSADVVPA